MRWRPTGGVAKKGGDWLQVGFTELRLKVTPGARPRERRGMEVEVEARGPCRASPHCSSREPRRGAGPERGGDQGAGQRAGLRRDSGGREVGGDLPGSRDLG